MVIHYHTHCQIIEKRLLRLLKKKKKKPFSYARGKSKKKKKKHNLQMPCPALPLSLSLSLSVQQHQWPAMCCVALHESTRIRSSVDFSLLEAEGRGLPLKTGHYGNGSSRTGPRGFLSLRIGSLCAQHCDKRRIYIYIYMQAFSSYTYIYKSFTHTHDMPIILTHGILPLPPSRFFYSFRRLPVHLLLPR